MDWMTILAKAFELVILPLLGALISYLVVFIRRKGAEIAAQTEDATKQKYVNMLTETIADCVAATTQSYVDSLKKQGKFDTEAQKEAFKRSYESIMAILTEDAKDYLNNLYGDLKIYITEKIEAEVKAQK